MHVATVDTPPHDTIIIMDETRATAQAVPTIDDLRVKLCYICREEERADSATAAAAADHLSRPRRRWTHPCRCTLVAHTACLLKWIQTSQASQTSSSSRALKCPQCDAPYRIESDEPALLKVLVLGNRVLQRVGTYFTLVGVAGVVGIAGTSVYICMTAYGAYALERFIGSEMFNLILTDDPINWPWSAYLNLPLIPLALVLSRFPRSPSTSSTASLLFPLLLSCWPSSSSSSFPSPAAARRMTEFWGRRPESPIPPLGPSVACWWWPPPPVLFALLGVPIVRRAYRSLYKRVYKKVLGVDCLVAVPPSGRRAANDNNNNNNGNGAEAAAGPVVVVGVLEGMEAGGVVVGGDDARRNADNDNDNEGGGGGGGAAVQAAEQLIEINASSLGRKIGGALLIPALSNLMGALLYKFGRRSEWVGAFLGMRGGGGRMGGAWGGRGRGRNASFDFPFWPRAGGTELDDQPPPSSWRRRFLGLYPTELRRKDNNKEWRDLTLIEKVHASVGLVVNAALLGWGGVSSSSSTGGGSSKQMWWWTESDPVWWRNCVGFAIFVAVKDAIYLVHLWLKKRELESRRVKDRDFAGIEVGELDLLPEFFLRAGLRT